MSVKDKTESLIEITKPKLYKVILLNDDCTTFDFVIDILKTVFHKSEEEAIKLTFKVDREGSAIIGVYPYEIAATKIEQTHALAIKNNFPLKAIMEGE